MAPAAPARVVLTPRVESLRQRLHKQEVRAVNGLLARRIPWVSTGGARRREIALTFDDGPGPFTLSVVRQLSRLHVPATFFQVGFMAPLFPQAERAVASNPLFVIGDHTERHAILGRLSRAAQAAQVDDQAWRLSGRGIPYPHLFRPPFGIFNRTTLAILRRRHMLMVLWSVDSQDYRRRGTAAIVSRVLRAARPGAIVLMHDAGGDRSQTVAAVPAIVKALRRRHYQLVTVPRLLQDNPPPRRQTRPTY
jgi:peptidoglycan/xylan/chitin deacetylase (PgdA/CDA1 family)